MKNTQKGFGLAGVIAVVAVMSLVGFIGYFVWDKNKTKEVQGATANSATLVTPTPTVTAKATATPTPSPTPTKVPDGYVLYENSNPKFSFVYPKEWDSHKNDGWSKGVNIDIKPTNEWVHYGWGSPYSYKYDTTRAQWLKFDNNTKEESLNNQVVLWKDDTKTIYDFSKGEGGGWQSAVSFIKDSKIYIIQAPSMGACESPNGCYTDTKAVTIGSKVYLDQIARSITF